MMEHYPIYTVNANKMPFVEEIQTPLPPIEAFKRLCDLPYALFLDSSKTHKTLGRYSFIAADPIEFLEYRPASTVDAKGAADDVFSKLQEFLDTNPQETLEDLPPFQGGLAGLFSYDLHHCIEDIHPPQFDEFRVPYVAVGIYLWVIAYDLERERCWLISHSYKDRVSDADAATRAQEILLKLDGEAATGPMPTSSISRDALCPQFEVKGLPGLTSNFTKDAYLAAAAKTIEYIYAGDIFQANLSQRLLCPWERPALNILEHLRDRNPSNFGAYFDAGSFVLASASPERFLCVHDGEVETRPIKGTRRRQNYPEADAAVRDELRDSSKDRAENVMIVDLLRNDLSKVAEPDSVTVPKLFEVESAEFVHHLVSQVRARLLPGLTPLTLLDACFPGGSITGAPKVRAMEIIAELEPTARGAYCGSLAYIGFDGTMDSNLLIRTFTCKDGWIQFPVGGGIVSQSVPEAEYAETMHKAEGMLRALT